MIICQYIFYNIHLKSISIISKYRLYYYQIIFSRYAYISVIDTKYKLHHYKLKYHQKGEFHDEKYR